MCWPRVCHSYIVRTRTHHLNSINDNKHTHRHTNAHAHRKYRMVVRARCADAFAEFLCVPCATARTASNLWREDIRKGRLLIRTAWNLFNDILRDENGRFKVWDVTSEIRVMAMHIKNRCKTLRTDGKSLSVPLFACYTITHTMTVHMRTHFTRGYYAYVWIFECLLNIPTPTFRNKHTKSFMNIAYLLLRVTSDVWFRRRRNFVHYYTLHVSFAFIYGCATNAPLAQRSGSRT